MTWRPATPQDLAAGARVGYRGGYGRFSMRKGRVKSMPPRETGDFQTWKVLINGHVLWGYLDQFYVEVPHVG